MNEPTEADREKASELADQIDSMGPAMTYRTLAAALAAERAKARAPFLALAAAVKDGWGPSADRLADAIRHVGEDPT